MALKTKLNINKKKCKGCELCVINCPNNILKMSEEINSKGHHYVQELKKSEEKPYIKDCTGCGLCFQMCPDLVITINEYKENPKSKKQCATTP